MHRRKLPVIVNRNRGELFFDFSFPFFFVSTFSNIWYPCDLTHACKSFHAFYRETTYVNACVCKPCCCRLVYCGYYIAVNGTSQCNLRHCTILSSLSLSFALASSAPRARMKKRRVFHATVIEPSNGHVWKGQLSGLWRIAFTSWLNRPLVTSISQFRVTLISFSVTRCKNVKWETLWVSKYSSVEYTKIPNSIHIHIHYFLFTKSLIFC